MQTLKQTSEVPVELLSAMVKEASSREIGYRRLLAIVTTVLLLVVIGVVGMSAVVARTLSTAPSDVLQEVQRLDKKVDRLSAQIEALKN